MQTAFAQLDRLFDPTQHHLSDEGARILVELRDDAETESKMELLAAKANQGTLTPDERREYESWVRAGTLISILQAKARLYLKRLDQAA